MIIRKAGLMGRKREKREVDVSGYTPEGLAKMAAGVVDAACDDYRKLCKKEERAIIANDKDAILRFRAERNSLRYFFDNSPFMIFTDMSGASICNELEHQVFGDTFAPAL